MKTHPRQYILGLGSNLGDRATLLAQAIDQIKHLPGTRLEAISQAVDSDPVGITEQPEFLNICILVVTELNPDELLAATMLIEQSLGRVRPGLANGPRSMDIDLLLYEGGTWVSPAVTLPHPRWSTRGFVVIPLSNLLQGPALAKSPWGVSLQAEVSPLAVSGAGVRAWQGPTPWNQSLR